jgi:pimeloyl-ACP methyl ester carboxylesterase
LSILVILVGTLLLGSPPSVTAQEATPPGTPRAAEGDFSGLVDIGGRSLWLTCMGEGTPTVILEYGSPGMTSADWSGVQSEIAQFTHVCAYDRANVGRSDPAPMPRTVEQMADDLDALLSAASIPGPYVLASFSFGPWVSRVYASQHPDDIAGLVLIDGEPEDLEARWKAVLPADLAARWLQDYWGGNPEGIALEESEDQVRNARPLPVVPLIVIGHGDARQDPHLIPTGWPGEVLDPIWKALVAKQADLVPGGRLVVAEQSSHGIPFEQPELVIDAVREVVEAVRDPSSWAASATPEEGTPTP